MEADRDREMVDVIVKKIEAEERAEQEQYLKSRYVRDLKAVVNRSGDRA